MTKHLLRSLPRPIYVALSSDLVQTNRQEVAETRFLKSILGHTPRVL